MENNIVRMNSAKNIKTNYLIKIEEWVMFLTGIFIAITMFIQVILRYVFSSTLFGLEEISILIVSWFYFFGTAYSIYYESSIKADVVDLFVKNKNTKKVCSLFSHILSAISAGILFYYSLQYSLWLHRSNVVTAHFLISENVGFCSIVVGSFLMVIHFIGLFLKIVKSKEIQYN